jgi:hypothetical protein
LGCSGGAHAAAIQFDFENPGPEQRAAVLQQIRAKIGSILGVAAIGAGENYSS